MRCHVWLFLCFCLLPSSWAPAAQPAGGPAWVFHPDAGWECRDLPLGRLFQPRVNGQPVKATETPLEEGADPRVRHTSYQTENFRLDRVTTWEEKRNAIRILDVFSNTAEKAGRLQVEYSTVLGALPGVRLNGSINQAGKSQEQGSALPGESSGAVFFAEREGSPFVPLFLWGQPKARWPVSILDADGTLRLAYQGTVPPQGRAALVHWVAAARLSPTSRPERSFDAFLKDDKVLAAGLPEEIAPLVVNFEPGTLQPSGDGPSGVAGQKGRLVALDGLLAKAGLQRGDKDMVWTGGNQPFQGDIAISGVVLLHEGREIEFPAAAIAALRGGGGRGREHRLFLRDGSVISGQVVLEKALFKGEIGTMALNVASLDLLVWRNRPEDGQVPEGSREYVQMVDGSHFWLAPGSVTAMAMIAEFGRLDVSGKALWSMERRSDPPSCMMVSLTDGSRIHAVAADQRFAVDLVHLGPKEIPVAGIACWGATEAFLKEAKRGTGDEPAASGGKLSRYCRLREGSLLAGGLADGPLRVRVNFEELHFQPQEIDRMLWEEARDTRAVIELAKGIKLRGQVLNETLPWRLGSQVVALPTGMVLEVISRQKP